MFELWSGRTTELHETKEAALASAKAQGFEAFEILDDDGRQVYLEFPRPAWYDELGNSR